MRPTIQPDLDLAVVQLRTAAVELVRWQQALWDLFCQELGRTPTDYFTKERRHSIYDGFSLSAGEWLHTFHGVECDFHHTRNGRIVQIECLWEGAAPGIVGLSSMELFLNTLPGDELVSYNELFAACASASAATVGNRIEFGCLLSLFEVAVARSALVPLFPDRLSPWYRVECEPIVPP